jgi:tRNA G37 N-methylase TrmD
MMTKLMITALLFCSSLSLAGDAPKKKPSKIEVIQATSSSTSDAQKVDETVFGGTGGLSTRGSDSLGTAAPKKAKMVRATPAPTK